MHTRVIMLVAAALTTALAFAFAATTTNALRSRSISKQRRHQTATSSRGHPALTVASWGDLDAAHQPPVMLRFRGNRVEYRAFVRDLGAVGEVARAVTARRYRML